MTVDSGGNDLAAYAEKRIGRVLRGKYRLDRVIGVGGMAVVYRATHRNQAEFAVKMLHPELSLREDIRTRFVREGYAANSVKHQGVVFVHDDDVDEDGAAFLVMELLDGAPCETVWEQRGHRLMVDAVCEIGSQLLDVLAAAHAKGIVHRDLKPANLFLTREGRVKVLDFGIARVRDAASSSGTMTGMLLGTPAFMAPEQALAKTSEIDALTDLWAVGATLFTLLSGSLVHEGDNAQQLLVHAATRHARALASVCPSVPSAVSSVIDRALRFDRKDRWQSANEMLVALKDATRGCGIDLHRGAITDLLDASAQTVAAAPTTPRESTRTLPLQQPPTPRADQDVVNPTGATLPAHNTPAEAHPISAGVLPDFSTADPVAKDAAQDHPFRSTSKIATLALAAVVVLGGAGVIASRSVAARNQPGAAPASSGDAPGSPKPESSAFGASTVALSTGVAHDESPPPTVATPTASIASTTSTQTRRAPVPTGPITPSRSVPSSPAMPSASATAAASAQRCRSVSYVGADGETHFKKVCE